MPYKLHHDLLGKPDRTQIPPSVGTSIINYDSTTETPDIDSQKKHNAN